MPTNYPSRSSQKPASARSVSGLTATRHDPPSASQSHISSRTRAAALLQAQQASQPSSKPNTEESNFQVTQSEITEAGSLLVKHQWIPKEATVKYKDLIHALILISSTPNIITNVASGIRAVATLLSAYPPDTNAEAICDYIEDTLHPTISKEVLSKLKDESSAQFDNLRVSTETQLQALRAEIEDTKRTVLTSSEQIAKDVITSIENRLASNQGQAMITDFPANPQASLARPSYAQMLKSVIGDGYKTDPIPSLIAKTLMKMRQVFVDDLTKDFRDKPEATLVRLANEAVSFIPEEVRRTGPENMTINSVRRTKNGGLIFEFQDTDVVNWLSRQNLLSHWVKLFAGEGRARGNSYATIAKFVPVSYNVNSPAHLEQAAFHTGIPLECVVSMRWIKPPQFRCPGQQHAHMIIVFDDPEHANCAIEQGFCFNGKQVAIQKLAIEVKRCSKCQKLDTNHTTRDCPDPEPTCARCAKHHPTNDCKCEEHETHCANCDVPGHMATDRNCPKFLEHNERISERNPENDFKFFVTKNPASHARLNSSSNTHRYHARQAPPIAPHPSLPNRPSSPQFSPPRDADTAFRDSPPHIRMSPRPSPTPRPHSLTSRLERDLLSQEEPTDTGNADDEGEDEDDYETEHILDNSVIKIGRPIPGLGTTAPRPRIESSRKGTRRSSSTRPGSRASTTGDDQETQQTSITNFFQKKNKHVAFNSPPPLPSSSQTQLEDTPTRQWRISPERSQASSRPSSQRS